MSSRLMEPGIAAAIAAGRVIIVPSAQRAAALRWNWARLNLAQGHAVWQTPEIIPWEAWLDSQWDRARLEGRVAAGSRRLNRSQQLQMCSACWFRWKPDSVSLVNLRSTPRQ